MIDNILKNTPNTILIIISHLEKIKKKFIWDKILYIKNGIIHQNGIGFHGDAERKVVIATRLGATIPLHYQWYTKSNPIGKRVELNINHGDIYVMSEKATGYDWKKSSLVTLRHAAGADKFLRKK